MQTIADTYWRLDRIRAMGNSLFGLAASQEHETSHSDVEQALSLHGRFSLRRDLS